MSESADFRWGDVTQCCSCDSEDIDRQTADEGWPFSCNNCGLEFFKDTGDHTDTPSPLRELTVEDLEEGRVQVARYSRAEAGPKRLAASKELADKGDQALGHVMRQVGR